MSEKLKVLVCMVNQMLSFAGVRDEIDARNENVWETRVELRKCRAEENKRIKEHDVEEKRIAKEERKKLLEEKMKEVEAKKQNKNKALEDRLKKDENSSGSQKEPEPVVQKSPEKKEEKVGEGPRMTSRQLNLMKEKEKEQEAMILKEKEAEAAYRDLGEDAKRADFLEREREVQVMIYTNTLLNFHLYHPRIQECENQKSDSGAAGELQKQVWAALPWQGSSIPKVLGVRLCARLVCRA